MSTVNGSIAYRPEIDGLRAMAVLPVLFYHAGTPGFSGGYVGVDIFFVISGYLITSIIMHDMDAGGFSLKTFYERRARRILPVLYLTILFCIPIAFFTMLPDHFENFGQSVFATTLFANNFLLAATTGYWSLDIEFKPLVHTWSLGVEEQFYLIFPLFAVWLLNKLQKTIYSVAGILFILGLAFGIFGSYHFPSMNFYLPFGRSWEILAGCIVAVVMNRSVIKSNELGAAAGLILIMAPVFLYDASFNFPSLPTLVPVLGSVLIILYASKTNMTGQLLSSRLMVGIGLISYSAYMFHQPTFAFMRIVSKDKLPFYTFILVIPLILFVARLSLKYFETPFRKKNAIGSRKFALVAIFFTAVIAMFGILVHINSGYPERIFAKSKYDNNGMYISYNESVKKYKSERFKSNNKVNILIIGDCFSRDVANMVLESGISDKVNLVYRDDFGSCPYQNMISSGNVNIYNEADLIFISEIDNARENCIIKEIKIAKDLGKKIFVFGTKTFGYNINWITRIPVSDRSELKNNIEPSVKLALQNERTVVPRENYVSIMNLISVGDEVIFTDKEGSILSLDRFHLSKAGATYLGQELFDRRRFLKEVFVDG